MADTTLTTGTGGGSQTTTSSPQSAGSSTGYLPATSSVQTGTANALLEGQGSIPLNVNQPVTTVALGQASNTTVQQAPPAHHTSPLAIAAIVVLVLFAIGTFISTNRSAKNTTN